MRNLLPKRRLLTQKISEMTEEEASVIRGMIRSGATDEEIYANVSFWVNIQEIVKIRKELKNEDKSKP